MGIIPKYPTAHLWFYDAWITNVANPYCWGVSTVQKILPLFQRNVGRKHCDIGVGTGYYLANIKLAQDVILTLVDIEESPLQYARERILEAHNASSPPSIELLKQDVLTPGRALRTDPASLKDKEKYDSISLGYLLHTLPGPASQKSKLLADLRLYLKPKTGTLFGVTVLGKGPERQVSLPGRILMWLCNHVFGVFDNWQDTAEEFEEALSRCYATVECEVVGTVFIFKATGPLK